MTDVIQTTISGADLYIIDDNNNTLVVDSTNVRVGIGTNTPGYELSVAGNIHGTGLVQGVNLTIQAGGGGVLTFADGTTQSTAAGSGGIGGTIADTQVAFGTAADTIGGDANFSYATGTGTLLLGAANAGFLGVGTAAAPTGGRVVEIQGSNAANNIILVKNTGGTSSLIQFEDTSTIDAPIIGSNANDLILETQNAIGTIKFEVNASQLAMQLKADKSMRMIGKLGDYNDTAPVNGQLLIGNSAGTFDAATLTAGSNISISNNAGGITITGTASMSSFLIRGDGSNTASIDDGDTLQFTGGTGLTTAVSVPETVTFTLDDTAVTPGSYTYASITVDQQGRLTAASSGAAPGTMSSFEVDADAGVNFNIADGDVIDFDGGTGISTQTLSATKRVQISLDNTAVTPATYGSVTTVPEITVDQQGRITSATNTSIAYPAQSFTLTADSGSNQTINDGDTMDIAGGTGITTAVGATDTVTVNLDNTAVTPGSYTYSTITVDQQGRLTAASSGAAPGTMSSWTIAGDIGGETVTDGNTVTIAGGIGINTGAGPPDTVSIDLADVLGITPGTYTNSTITVDQQGRLTAASSGSTPGTMSSFTLTGDSGSDQTISDGETLDVAGGTGISTVVGATDTVTVNLDDTAVSAGSYTYSAITVDAQGRLTSASSGTAPASAANPTAEVSGSAVNGSAATFMRSDAAPALANTTVTAGSYTRAGFTVDAQGRLTAASSGSAPDISGTIATGQVAYGASADTIEGDNNLFWDTANDRLGIGTNAPSSSLHIIGIDDDNPEVRLQRTGVATQYLSMMNEDASGSFINSESAESNKKALYLQSVHNSGGSAGGDNLIIWRTGAASGPTERMRISDVNSLFTVQSNTDMNVESKLAVGKTSAPSYTLEVEGSNSETGGFAELTGGLFSSSSGNSSLTNGMPGWWLTAKGMNTTSKYTPALKFGSTDPDFTTTNPKWTAGIIGEAIETYAADDKGGMDMHFLTAPAGVGAATVPTINMTLAANGNLGIGETDPATKLHVNSTSGVNNLGLFVSSDATARISFKDNSTGSNTHVGIGAVGNDLALWAGNTTRLTLQSGGNVSFESGKLDKYAGSAPAAGQLLIGDATAGVWDAATLTAGSNITITNADGAITIAASGGGGGTPAGGNTEIQYNNGGAFGASAQLTFNGTTLGCGQNITAGAKVTGADLNTTITGGGYALTTTANHVWPGANVGSSPTVMPAIDLSAGPYDFGSLGGAGDCSETHYLMVIQGDPGGANAIIMPDPAAIGLPAGSRWTISFNDPSGQQQIVEFPAIPLNGVYSQIDCSAIGAVTLFTDGAAWFVESDVDTSGAGRLRYL